jgi:hypothetical protein
MTTITDEPAKPAAKVAAPKAAAPATKPSALANGSTKLATPTEQVPADKPKRKRSPNKNATPVKTKATIEETAIQGILEHAWKLVGSWNLEKKTALIDYILHGKAAHFDRLESPFYTVAGDAHAFATRQKAEIAERRWDEAPLSDSEAE